jgi:hypothetical protein
VVPCRLPLLSVSPRLICLKPALTRFRRPRVVSRRVELRCMCLQQLSEGAKSSTGPQGFSAIGRTMRSTTLESISIRPSSRKRVNPSHRPTRHSGSPHWSLADQGELSTQPRFESSMIGRLLSWRTAVRSSHRDRGRRFHSLRGLRCVRAPR